MSSLSPHPLFSPLQLGAFHLAHRVVLPAIQRHQALLQHGVPGQSMVDHYAERATPGGLLVTEATWVSANGHADGREPGLYTPEQVNAWRQVTAAVHARGGIVLCQLGLASPGTPAHALSELDVDQLLRQLRDAAECAGDAGFDGVELLGTLPGHGPGEDGGRLLLDFIHTLGGVWAHNRMGLRLSATRPSLATLAASALGAGLAYVHVGPAWPTDTAIAPDALLGCLAALREASSPAEGSGLVASGGFTAASARSALEAGLVDAIGFGRPFLANADLAYRLRYGAPLREDGGGDLPVGNISGSATSPTALRCDADPWSPGPP